MDAGFCENWPLQCEADVVRVRRAVRERMAAEGFSGLAQTKMVTAVSELGRNTLIHGGGGFAVFEGFELAFGFLVRVIFVDHGPGIADVELALSNGFSTGSGLGLGLGGAKRLAEQFAISSTPGVGTRVSIAMQR